MKLSHQELEDLARDTRDPATLPDDIYVQMVNARVGPFAYDWPRILEMAYDWKDRIDRVMK